MANMGIELDIDSIEPGRGSFDPIPAAWYPAEIRESEVATTKEGAGKMLKMQFAIIDGEYVNRIVFYQPCFQHTNPQTQAIALGQIKDICTAIDHKGPLIDSEVLHYHPMMIKVVIRPAGLGKDGKHYEAKNEVTGWKAMGTTNAPARPTAKLVAAETTMAGTVADAVPDRPWRNRK